MPAIHSNINCVITILIHTAKMQFHNIFIMLLHRVAKDMTSSLILRLKCNVFNATNFDVIANENARRKGDE